MKRGIYGSSKTIHAEVWRQLRDSGVPIISTWIDEAGIGETKSWVDLWRRCVHEAATAEWLIVYGQKGEILKGGLVEVGAALGAGVPVLIAGQVDGMKNAANHPGVWGVYRTILEAVAATGYPVQSYERV